MLRKAKRFLKNPVYLLMLAVSLAVISIGSVMAFNAMAAGEDNLPDLTGTDYRRSTASYFFFSDSKASENIFKEGDQWQLRTYYIKSTPTKATGTLTITDDNKGTVTDEEGNPVTPNGNVTITIPEYTGNAKIWKYKEGYDEINDKFYLCCVGSANLSQVFSQGEFTISDLNKPVYQNFNNITFSPDGADDTTSGYENVEWDEDSYYYAIGDDKPYSEVGTSDGEWPEWENVDLSISNYEILSIINPGNQTYACSYSYNVNETMEYSRYDLDVNAEGGFAYTAQVIDDSERGIDFPVKSSGSTISCIFAIYNGNDEYIAPTEYNPYARYRKKYGLVFLNNDFCEVSELQLSWSGMAPGGTHTISVPISITVKYNYDNYEGKGTISGGPNNESILYTAKTYYHNRGELLSNTILDTKIPLPSVAESPTFTKTGEGTAKPTLRWKTKSDKENEDHNNTNYIFTPGESYKVGNIADVDHAVTLGAFDFNNATGYFERTSYVEPIFEGEVRLLIYKDARSQATATEMYNVDDSDPTAIVQKFMDNYYGLNWRDNNGIPINYYDIQYINNGSTFLHWLQTTPKPTDDGIRNPNDTITLTAPETILETQWERSTYRVIYDGNGETKGTAPTDYNQYSEGDIATVLGNGNLERKGYTFGGWNTQVDGNGTPYQPNDTITMQANDVFLYAQWDPLPTQTYTLTYNPNAADTVTNMPNPDNVSWNSTEVDSTLTLSASEPTRTGYKFLGWDENKDAATATYKAGAQFTKVANDVTLYAIWTPTYTVTYNANGATSGTAPTDNNQYLESETVTVLGDNGLKKDGHIFGGWKYDNNTTYNAGNKFAMPAHDVTLTAVWTPTYTVTYDGNGSDDDTKAPTDDKQYLEKAEVTVLDKGNLEKDGFKFKEWNTMPNGTGTSYNASAKFDMPAHNVVLYAIWTADSETTTTTTTTTTTSGGSTTTPDSTTTATTNPSDGEKSPVPKTGEDAFGVNGALGLMMNSAIIGGCVVALFIKKCRKDLLG